MPFIAKKSLGQNFLNNEALLQKITTALRVESGDVVVEVGPGEGSLTKHLLNLPASKIIAVEKDRRLIETLRAKFADPRLTIIEGDALDFVPALDIKKFKLIGNIPYYITGHLLRVIGELSNKPTTSVFVVQKEVAERAAAKPPKNNILALSLQFWSNPEFLGIIKKENFRPVPKVDSAILRLNTITPPDISPEKYFSALRLLFSHPRKTILNNLSSRLPKEEVTRLLEALGLSPSLRPENLSLGEVVKIAGRI